MRLAGEVHKLVQEMNQQLLAKGYRKRTLQNLLAGIHLRRMDRPMRENFSRHIEGLRAPRFIHSPKYAEQQNRAALSIPRVDPDTGEILADLVTADPDIVRFARSLIEALRAYDVPLFPHCFVRGYEEQTRAFERGFSQVQYPNSEHNVGRAVDVIHGVKGWDMDKNQWKLIGDLGKEIAGRQKVKVKWGGDWSFYDPAHWELT